MNGEGQSFFEEHGFWPTIGWGAGILIIGISVASLLTQGVLTLTDKFYPADEAGQAARIAENVTSKTDNQRPLGSDEGDSESVLTEDPTHQYTLSGTDAFPRLTAGAYLAADLETGEIILDHNESLIAPMASVSKLMTGLIAEEQMNLQKSVIVSRDAYNTYGAQGKLVLGEKIRLYDLMHPLLMESSNDGAEVIADSYDKGHDAFMAEMNRKAKEIGMTDTYYDDPSGLSPQNVTKVTDLLKLARYIFAHQPQMYDITRVRQYSILKHTWVNQNRFLNYDTFMGGKNGYIDESKKTTVSLFNVPMARGGNRPIVIVILRSDDREGDAVKIINFLKRNAYFDQSQS